MHSFRQSDKKIVLLLLVLSIVPSVICGCMKSGFFMDEYYTYGFANADGPLYFTERFTEENPLVTDEDIYEYLVVPKDRRFTFGQTVENVKATETTPILYYLFLHFNCSLTPGVFSKWQGLVINIVCHVITVFVVYLCVETFTKHKKIACLGTLAYACNTVVLDTVIYIRIYAMAMMFCALFLYVLLKLFQNESDLKKHTIYSIFAGLLICLSFLTVYNTAIVLFFLCGGYCIYMLFQKQYKKMWIFGACAFGGIALFLLLWPHFFAQMEYNGLFQKAVREAYSEEYKEICQNPNLKARLAEPWFLGLYARLMNLYNMIIECMYWSPFVAIGSFLAAFVSIRNRSKKTAYIIVVSAAGLLTVIVSGVTACFPVVRYLSILYPGFLIVIWCMTEHFCEKKERSILCYLIIAMLCIYSCTKIRFRDFLAENARMCKETGLPLYIINTSGKRAVEHKADLIGFRAKDYWNMHCVYK